MQPPSSSLSLRPPLHSAVRPSFGSLSSMVAVRSSGANREHEGSLNRNHSDEQPRRFGNHNDLLLKQVIPNLDQTVADTNHHRSVKESFHGVTANPSSRSSNMESVIEGGTGIPSNRSINKESPLDGSAVNPSRLLADMETRYSMHQPSSINDLTMEKLALQIADLQKLVAKQSLSSRSSSRSRSQQRKASRSKSRTSRPPTRHDDSKQKPPAMDRAWNKVVQQDDIHKPQQMSLQFFPPLQSAEGISVCPPVEVAQEGMDRWQRTLVGYFIEGRPSFTAIKEQVTKLWSSKGLIDVMANERGFFFFKFASAAD